VIFGSSHVPVIILLTEGMHVVMSPPGCPEHAGLLQDRLIVLAGTPDDNPLVGTDLIIIARLAVNRVSAVDHASVTSRRQGGYATLAASSDLAVAVDEAQYGDNAGPCLEALEADYPAAVPDIAATMTWAGFRETAARHGLRTSLSIPLSAASGRTIASLNLYSHHYDGLRALTTAVWTIFDSGSSESWNRDALEPGARELTAGLIGALGLRNMIRQAFGLIMAGTGCSEEDAYQRLRARADKTGTVLTETAARIIEQHRT
jgi:hypothetical protein